MAKGEYTREDKRVFSTVCAALDREGWKYETSQEKLMIVAKSKEDGVTNKFLIDVNAKLKLIVFVSDYDFKFAENKIVDGALACSVVNYGLTVGSFDFDIEDGSVMYRFTSGYTDSIIGESLVRSMIHYGNLAVDTYRDSFSKLAEGSIDLNKFIELEG